MTQIMAGDPAALEALYDQYAPAVMGFVLRVVQDRAMAEDIVQETFWRVWKNRAGFRGERGTVSSWLFAIARNIAIDRWRRMKHHPTTRLNAPEDEHPEFENQADPGANVAETVWDTLQHRQVRAAIQALPKEQSLVIRLAFFQGLTRQEIAERIQVPLGTVHTRARLALQKLRGLLMETGFEE